jgi:deoxyribonucleoside regulator
MREAGHPEMLRICYLYYREERTQEEISKLLGYSRFKISRILKEARKRGLVTITINDPRVDLAEAEIELANKFDLKQAIVVRTNELSGRSPLDQLGEAGARYLRNIVNRHRIMGVTWGFTVYHVASNLEPLDAANLSLVQIGGGLGTIEGSDNNMLTMMFGQKLGAKAFLIPAPVIVRDRAIRDTLFKEKKIQETLAMAKKADLVLFGVGIIGPEGLLWKSGFLKKADALKLEENGAVGAICGRFFDARGQQCWHELDERTIGLNLDELRNIRHKICVATGEEKLQGVLGALRGKLVDVLVTDEEMAGRLLSQDAEAPSTRAARSGSKKGLRRRSSS